MKTWKRLNVWATTRRGHRILVALAGLVIALDVVGLCIVVWQYLYQTPFGLALDLIMLAGFASLAVLPVWPFLALLRRLAAAVLPRQRTTIEEYGRFRFYAAAVFLLLLAPHIWMSAKLAPLKRQFDKVAHGSYYDIHGSGQYADGRQLNEMDYGGRLDDIVELRDAVLLKYGFLPAGFFKTARWETSTSDVGFANVFGAYVRLPLTREAYRNGLATVIGKLNKEDPKVVRQHLDSELAKIRL